MRRLAVALSTAALAALMALTAAPASADPALAIDNLNGRRVVRVENPDNPNCYVTVTVDQHYGFAEFGDAGPEYASANAWVAKGPCAKRIQVDNLRLRINPDAGVAVDTVVNDFFPAKTSNPRNNTPTDCWDGPVTKQAAPNNSINAGPGTSSLYDERAPKDGVCETEADEVRNNLHNVFDYDPDTSLIKAFGDWIAISGSGATIQRTFVSVQWNAAPGVPNWSITRHSVLSSTASYGS
jgi:hypothetical protein